MKPADRDVTKLPKWAQSRIKTLERDLAYNQAKLAAGPDDSDTFADPYSDAARPLGRGATIEFRVNPESKVRVRIIHTGSGPVLDVNADRGLLVQPTASNAIRIRV